MILRLFFTWAFVTLGLFGFYYFVDRMSKQETAKWAGRVGWCGVASALLLVLIVFLERL